MSVTNFDQVGDPNHPSPSIWKNFRKTLINDLGLGYYRHVNFLGAPTGVLAAALDVTMVAFGDALSLSADLATVLAYKSGEVGGVLDIETDGDDNDAFALISQPIGKIVKNSGVPIAYEVLVELGDVAMDGGAFFGFVEEAGANLDVVVDAAGALVGESLVGFQILTANPDSVDAVYKKDAGTVVVAATDVTNSTNLDSGDRASLVNDTKVKLGVKFDGILTIRWYVNGVVVAAQDVDSTVDQAKDYSAIASLKTGAAAAESAAFGFLRYSVIERR